MRGTFLVRCVRCNVALAPRQSMDTPLALATEAWEGPCIASWDGSVEAYHRAFRIEATGGGPVVVTGDIWESES